jgi:Bacterial Ig-like domain (group 2)
MRGTALTLGVLLATVAVGLSSCGRSAPTGPSKSGAPAILVTVKVVAPSTIAPGSTAQLAALATYTDGSSKDVTAAVQWHSSDPSILTIDATGLAAGVRVGDVKITATASSGVASATQSIVVVPAGTFRLSGLVYGLEHPLDAALVQVTAGIGAGLESSTGVGLYRLYGVAGTIQLTVSKAGYVTSAQAVVVNDNNTTLNFALTPVVPPPDVAGTYTLDIAADPACTTTDAGSLPSVARERRYMATIYQQAQNPPIKVALSGPDFIATSSHAFFGFHTTDGATFDVNDPIYYYSGLRDLAELLPDGNVYLASGHINVSRSGDNLVGSLNGTIRIALASNLDNIVGQCTSVRHPVTFTNQGGSPARVRTGG